MQPIPGYHLKQWRSLRHLTFLVLLLSCPVFLAAQQKPNVVIIYTDDLGFGDLACYGATRLQTPHIDRLAEKGLKFTNGHASSATCTPSRYALMTGRYPWRKQGTAILPGDAALIVPADSATLPKVFQQAGYQTGIVGKWHLGLGNTIEKNWNRLIAPGPNETGFHYSFIFPATADRVPTVFLENGLVTGLDSTDPIEVSYHQKIGDEPTGKDHPELLKMKSSPSHGHDQTIINGIGRIGYMKGGIQARWTDEEMPLTFLLKAKEFIRNNHSQPFFLFYSLTEPHVPRMPSTMFKGKSGLGYRGDAILQLDWTVGEIMAHLEQLGLENKTIILFSSDNGPVLDDGYQDGAVTMRKDHQPAGSLRGGKYSAFEGGTRVPWILCWPGQVRQGSTDVLMSQVDWLRSFASLLKQPIPAGQASDSQDQLQALLGKSDLGRESLVLQGRTLSIIKNNWKYIEPSDGPALLTLTGIESGNAPVPQLYNLAQDIGEKNNLAAQYPEKVRELKTLLEKIKKN